jgi:hypothetical protein
MEVSIWLKTQLGLEVFKDRRRVQDVPCCRDCGIAEFAYPWPSAFVTTASHGVRQPTKVTPAGKAWPFNVRLLPVYPAHSVGEIGAPVWGMVVHPASRCATISTGFMAGVVVTGLDSTYETTPK